MYDYYSLGGGVTDYGFGGLGTGSMLSLILVVLCMIAASIASKKVSSTFAKYDGVKSMGNVTAEQAAALVLQSYGITDVTIQHIGGNLTDNYNPTNKVLSLSDSTYGHRSIAAIGVACHEAGHAAQHAEGYLPIRLRNAIIPACNFGTKAGVPIALVGVALGFEPLVMFGLILYSLIAVFQFVTLPVEFNASHRAMKVMEQNGILEQSELHGAGKVLKAAAMTYVCAMASTLANILRYAVILLSRSRRNN